MKMLRHFLGVFVVLTLSLVTMGAACRTTPLPPEPTYVETFDSGADGGDDDVPVSDLPDGALRSPDCAAACKTLKRLGCPEAAKPDGGLSCYDVCVKAETSSRSLQPKCVASKVSREGIRSCGTVRCLAP